MVLDHSQLESQVDNKYYDTLQVLFDDTLQVLGKQFCRNFYQTINDTKMLVKINLSMKCQQ